MSKAKKGKGQFSTISLPTPLVEEVERVVSELGYWSTKTDFIREGVVEKLEKYEKDLEKRRRTKGDEK